MFSVSRLFGKSRSAGPIEPGFDQIAATPPEQRIPVRTTPSPGDQPMPEKTGRSAQREALYGAVREAMVGAGVLSSRYKFKVLSTNREATEFVVMIDLADKLDGGQEQYNWIESLVARNDKARHQVVVKAVYWRIAEQTAFVAPRSPTSTALRSVLPHRPSRLPPFVPREAVAPVVPERSYTLQTTGYEDTEQGPSQQSPGARERIAPALSNTQYGDLH